MNRKVFERYVQEYCLDLARKQNHHPHRQRHSCILTYNNSIISTGVNVNLKNPFTEKFNFLKCLHAEASAIMRAISKHHSVLDKCELWVCRVGRESKLSRPCPMCMKIIHAFHIPIIHYTDHNGDWIVETLDWR